VPTDRHMLRDRCSTNTQGLTGGSQTHTADGLMGKLAQAEQWMDRQTDRQTDTHSEMRKCGRTRKYARSWTRTDAKDVDPKDVDADGRTHEDTDRR